MKRVHCILVFFVSFFIQAQDGSFNLGGRSAGMAGASLTLQDEFSLFNNIGGIGGIDAHTAFAAYQNRYGVSEFQVIGAGALYHSEIGNAGVGFYKFGDDIFSQQRIHLAIGNKIQMVSLGLGLDLLQYNISTIGTNQALAIQFGGIAEITPKMSFGAHIFNLNQAEISSETGEKIPTIMKGGFSYRPSSELMLNIEVEKDLDFDEIIKAGLEYQIIENVFVRTGISTNPSLGAFGVGFHPKNFKLDYAFSNDSNLGNIHEVSLAYSFKK
ncbi:PorV/PorQ family protein [Ekhidna sp.]